MSLDVLYSNIRARAAQSVADHLFGTIERPLSLEKDWLAHLQNACCTSLEEERDASFEHAAALIFVTLKTARRGPNCYTDSICDFKDNLQTSLSGRANEEDVSSVVDHFVEFLRSRVYQNAPTLEVLGEDANISFLLDFYRRYSHLREGSELAATMVTIADVGTKAVLLDPLPQEETSVSGVADLDSDKTDALEVIHYLADTVAGLGMALARSVKKGMPLPREIADLDKTVARAVSEYAAGAKIGVSQRFYHGLDLVKNVLSEHQNLILAP